MLNRIRKTNSIPQGSGETAGFVVKTSNNRPVFDLGSSADASATSGVAEKRYIPGNTYVSKTANFSVTAKDAGKTFGANSAAQQIASLPASNADSIGMEVTFVLEALPTAGVGFSVSPTATNQIIGNGFVGANDKDAIFSAASDRIGDALTLVADGNGKWIIKSVVGTVAREA